VSPRKKILDACIHLLGTVASPLAGRPTWEQLTARLCLCHSAAAELEAGAASSRDLLQTKTAASGAPVKYVTVLGLQIPEDDAEMIAFMRESERKYNEMKALEATLPRLDVMSSQPSVASRAAPAQSPKPAVSVKTATAVNPAATVRRPPPRRPVG
jgi:hypothetical protein